MQLFQASAKLYYDVSKKRDHDVFVSENFQIIMVGEESSALMKVVWPVSSVF